MEEETMAQIKKDIKESLATFIHQGGKLNSWGEVELFRLFNKGKLPTFWNILTRKKFKGLI